jgi:MFS family permease
VPACAGDPGTESAGRDKKGKLVAARALQGFSAALVSPAALSIVTTTFREGQERTRALSVWAAIAAGGGAFGLLFGGMLTEWLDWRWVFFVNIPIGALAIVASLRLIPESRQESAVRHFDFLGARPSPPGWRCSSSESRRRRAGAGER